MSTKRMSRCHPEKVEQARGMCAMCYMRMKRKGIVPDLMLYDALEAEGPPLDPDAPCCDMCAADDVPLARLNLVAAVRVAGKRTSRGAGVVELCVRCWARCRAKARQDTRWARRRRKAAA